MTKTWQEIVSRCARYEDLTEEEREVIMNQLRKQREERSKEELDLMLDGNILKGGISKNENI